jgi:hypothetical protein
MALLASPFDIFSLLYLCFLSFFFYIEKAKFFSSYWSCFIVKYLSVYEFHLLGFGIIHFWFGFNNLSFSFPLERLVNNSLCFDQFGWCFTHNMYITFFLIRFGEIAGESEVDVERKFTNLSPLPTSSATIRQFRKETK